MDTHANQIARIDDVINVASVPQRSPFRYPGGKTWLVPYIRVWLSQRASPPNAFIEPFAGGGIVSLTVAFERLAKHVTMVEIDEQVGAVWETILHGDGEWLANQIATFEMTPEQARFILSNNPATVREQAFKTIVKNRVNRGGILAQGAGMVKNGENGKGIHSRWYPQTLKNRILQIIAIRDRISFIQGDGLEILRQNSECVDTAFFIDPPYTASVKKAGTRLYDCSEIDHAQLFSIAANLTGDFLMTYDNDEEIRTLAERYHLEIVAVAMKNTHHVKMSELLIGKNLSWLSKSDVAGTQLRLF